MAGSSPPGRRGATAVALAVAVLAGYGLAGCGTPGGTPAPEDPTSAASTGGSAGPQTPAAPSPPATPDRSVTADNLLTVDDIANDDPISKEVVVAPDGAGRPVSQSYICLPENGLADLGATSMVTRDFTYKIIDAESDPYPDSPLKNKPAVYTQALQFPDQATATTARATYAGWIESCPTTLVGRGYDIDPSQSLELTKLRIDGGAAQAAMVAYLEPGAKDTEDFYWESAGVTQVGDRLMITIAISWGMDTPGGFDTSEGDASFINPVVTMAEIAAERLAG